MDLEGQSHLQSEFGKDSRRQSLEGQFFRLLHHDPSKNKGPMRGREELDDGLDRTGQGADGDVDARQKTDQGTQDRAGRGKSIDAFKPGNQVEHGDNGCQRRKDNHAQNFHHHQRGGQVAIPGDNIDRRKQEGEDREN